MATAALEWRNIAKCLLCGNEEAATTTVTSAIRKETWDPRRPFHTSTRVPNLEYMSRRCMPPESDRNPVSANTRFERCPGASRLGSSGPILQALASGRAAPDLQG
jgi:hypothetical protein